MPASRLKPVREWADGVESVPILAATPEALLRLNSERRWGFSVAELDRILTYFKKAKRDPTDVELAGIAQSWSEHCSYKSSKPFLQKAFADLRPKGRVLGTGDAGVMALVPGYAYALRIESHNHPSAVEPYGGAGTGIGGILRDVLAVGAKPIALADPLFFGPLSLGPDDLPAGTKSPRYLMAGVVQGIADYGNRVGVPTVTGSVGFDPAYTVNPLVNVACLGVLPRARLRPNAAQRAGDSLVLVGGRTGRDGIGGVAFASKELTRTSEERDRGAVQLGNPILKEPLIRACLEAYDRGLVQGVKDLGGGGVAAACGELAHAGGLGLELHLDRVPLREAGLLPWEIWISESQERMALEVRPKDVEALMAVFKRFDVPATAIGSFTPGHKERIYSGGKLAAELDLDFRIEALPAKRPLERPPELELPGASAGIPDHPIRLFERLVLAPDSVSREAILRIYDHEVQGRTAVKPLHGLVESPTHGDAAVIRPLPDSWAGIAVTVASQPTWCKTAPRTGGIAVAEEAARNLYAVGARPDALTDCLNFGNPEDPKVLGTFADVVDGLAEGARRIGFAVPSGNVSFYNGGLGRAIPPTPIVFATGLLPDLRRAVTSDLKREGDALFVVGPSSPELGGSLWARLNRREQLATPPVDPARLRRNGEGLLSAGRRGSVAAAHDIADGGLAVALAEMAFGGQLGFDVDLGPMGLPTPGSALAAEGGSRWIVEVPEGDHKSFARSFPRGDAVRIGTVIDGTARLASGDRQLGEVDLAGLYPRWRAGVGIP